MRMWHCPCGSAQSFEKCCGPYISKQCKPTTPEALMRSRYTAYSQANIGYILRTMSGKALKSFNKKEAIEWAKSADWLGLNIMNIKYKNDFIGYVEFIARYRLNGIEHIIHERSRFECIVGSWYYVGGRVLH